MGWVWSEPTPPRGARGVVDLYGVLKALESYGALGVFLMAYITNLIPGFPALYLLVIVSLSVVADDPYYQYLLVAAGGVGAGLGKVTLFAAARLLGRELEERLKGRSVENARYLVRKAGRSLFILVVVFAALPLPDDALYLPLGLAGYSLPAFTVAVVLGKTIMTAMVVALGAAAKEFVASTSNIATAAAGIAIGTLFFMALIFKVDWPRVVDTYARQGALAAAKALAEEIAGLFTRAFSALASLLSPARGEGGRRGQG